MTDQKPLEEIIATWNAFDRPIDGQKFRHYKGGMYEIVATGFLEETETPCVIYRSLLKNIVWVRTADDFFSEVDYEGIKQPRFKPV